MIFWNEKVSAVRIIGILCVVPAIIISGNKGEEGDDKGKGYFVPLLVSMIASGGLGIMQKVQQSTQYAHEGNAFVLLSFLTAGLISLAAALMTRTAGSKPASRALRDSVAVGLCFSVSNLLNTILAGALDSAIFFPILNIGRIMFSLLIGMIVFKEAFTRKAAWIISLGMAAILLINAG